MAHRNEIQLRAVRRYAHACGVDCEIACTWWCVRGGGAELEFIRGFPIKVSTLLPA